MSYPVKDALSWLYPPIEPYKTGKLKVSDLQPTAATALLIPRTAEHWSRQPTNSHIKNRGPHPCSQDFIYFRTTLSIEPGHIFRFESCLSGQL